MPLPKEIAELPKDALKFTMEKPKTLEQIWPWGLHLVKLMRPVAQFQGDIVSVSLYDALETACLERNEEQLDYCLTKLNEQKKGELSRGMRTVKGGVRLMIRPLTNKIRKLIGKDELKGMTGL